MAVDRPNYTEVPNQLLGDILKGNIIQIGMLADMGLAELKVFLVVCRLTFGYHQNERRASLTTLQKLTGLSRQGVLDGAEVAEKRGIIERVQDGGVTLWRVLVKPVDQSEKEMVKPVDQPVKAVDQDSQEGRPPSKKETKNKPEKETKESSPADFNLGQHDPLDGVPRATDGHQRAVDKANGGKGEDPIEEIVKHLRWLCVGRGAKLPRGSELRGYRKAARQLLEEKINTDDWQGVCEAIDDWSENPSEVDVWQRERTKKPQVALDCIAAHYWQRKNGGKPSAKNRGQRSRSGVQGSRTRPGYSVADPSSFDDSERIKAEIHAGREPDGPT